MRRRAVIAPVAHLTVSVHIAITLAPSQSAISRVESHVRHRVYSTEVEFFFGRISIERQFHVALVVSAEICRYIVIAKGIDG